MENRCSTVRVDYGHGKMSKYFDSAALQKHGELQYEDCVHLTSSVCFQENILVGLLWTVIPWGIACSWILNGGLGIC